MKTEMPPRKSGGILARAGRIILRLFLVVIIGALLLTALRFAVNAWYDWQREKEQQRIAAAVDGLPVKGGRMTLYSLDPMKSLGDPSNEEGYFHGFRILGQKEISDTDERARLTAMLAEDIRLKTDRWITQCFMPRHGLRIAIGEGVCDLVICFECRKIEAYNFGAAKDFNISGYAKVEFNAALDRHGIEKAASRSP